MPQEIATQRGVTVIAAGDTVTDVEISGIAVLANAFVRLIGNTLFIIGPDGGTTVDEINRDLSAVVTLTSATNLQIRSTFGSGKTKRVVWEIWEYVGDPGGPNEFIVRDADGFLTSAQTSVLGATIVSPWVATNNNDVVVFNRGLDWDAGNGATVDPSLGMYTLTAFFFAATNFFQFQRGNDQPTPTDSPEINYAAVEFTGANWTLQLIQNTNPPAGGTPVIETITNVSSWTRAFLHSQRIASAGVDINVGMIAYPNAATTSFTVQYAPLTLGGPFNAYRVMVISNPILRVVHDNSVTGPNPDSVPFLPGASPQQVAVPITVEVPARTDGAVFMSSFNVAAGTDPPDAIWVIEFQDDGSGGDEMLWRRSRSLGTSDWAHALVNFREIQTATWNLVGSTGPFITLSMDVFGGRGSQAKVSFQVTVTDPTISVEVLNAAITASIGGTAAVATIAQARAIAEVALAELPATIVAAIITVTIPTGSLGNAPEDPMATLNICPVDIDLCVTTGDNEPFSFVLTSDGSTPIVLTNFSFKLTGNTEEDPVDNTNQFLQLLNSNTPTTDGVVEFSPTVDGAGTSFPQANVGDNFFDVEQTDDATKIRTIIKGKLEIRQDITKP